MRRAVTLVVLLAFTAVCWSTAIRAQLEASRYPAATSLRYHEPTVTVETLLGIGEAQKLQTGNRIAFSAFTQLDGQSFESKEYQKNASASALLFYGDLRLVCTPRGMDGVFASSADTLGCAVDLDTAYELWGSRNVIGQQLRWNERDYTVRAVFDSPSGMVLIPANRETTEKFTAIALDTRGSPDVRNAAEEFRALYGLPQPNAVVTGEWMTATGSFFMLLPALALGFILLGRLLREVWAVRDMPVLFTLWCIVIAGIVALAVWLSGIRLSIPQSLIPTRWSDFEFWARTFRSWLRNLRDTFAAQRMLPDLSMQGTLLQLAACGIAATGSLLLFLRQLKKWNT